jgi:hypothetical protein
MYRIRFLLLLLPLLAGCSTTHTAPNLAAALIPALPYAPALDGGNVTPIQSPVVVKYAPYPTASFERLMRATGRGTAEPVSLSSRMTGTTFATSRGDLVELTFEVADVTTSPDARRDKIDSLLPKGAKITLLVEPFGSVKDVSVSLPTSSGNHTTPEALEKKLGQEFLGRSLLPKEELHQGEIISIDMSLPATSYERAATLKGKAVVQGSGMYRGRSVIVFEVTGIAIMDGLPLGMHSFRFLDTATGLWSHTETVIEGPVHAGATDVLLTAHFIDDVRF